MNSHGEDLYEDLSESKKKHYLSSQELDILRLPVFNEEVGLLGYYQGFNDGAYSFVGDEVEYYAERVLYEIENGKQLTDYYPTDCWVPREQLSYVYDPRCRPWYLASLEEKYNVIMTTYLSLDGLRTYVSLSKSILDENKDDITGVSAIDLDFEPIKDYLVPLADVNNLEGLYLVSSNATEVLFSELQEFSQDYLYVSNHIFRINKDSPKSADQEAFEAAFLPLMYDEKDGMLPTSETH